MLGLYDWEFPGAVYHLTTRGNGRQKIFFTDTDRELFLGTLAHVVSRYGSVTRRLTKLEKRTAV